MSLRDEVERVLNGPGVPAPTRKPTPVEARPTPEVRAASARAVSNPGLAPLPKLSLPGSWLRAETRPPIIHVVAPPSARPGMTRTWARRAGVATRRAGVSAGRIVHGATDRLERWTPASWSRTRARRIASRAASLALLLTLLVVIPIQFGPRGTSASQATGPVRGAYLGELVGARHVVRVHASSHGPLYSVLDAATRRVLAEDMLAGEVYRQFPDLDVRTMRTGPDAEPPDPESLRRPLMTAEPHRPELP
ncbi:MAG: hypothetical protein ACKVU4_00030 [Phycisphaerales bacterium]